MSQHWKKDGVVNEHLQDPMFHYGIAFCIFLTLAFVYGRKPILAWLDSEIGKIRSELDQASLLRAEAEAALASCKEKQARAEEDARAIISHAKQQIEEMRLEAKNELVATLKRHETLATERIRLAEQEAVTEVRNAAIELAVSIAYKTLTEKISDADAGRLIDQAIGDIPALKAERAKKAAA
jgi:F-type H+-transporting ATPase subunit b